MKRTQEKLVLIILAIMILIFILYIFFFKLGVTGNVVNEFNLNGEVKLIKECDIYPSISQISVADEGYSVRVSAPAGSFGLVNEEPSWISLGKKYWFGHWRAPGGASLGSGWVEESCFENDV